MNLLTTPFVGITVLYADDLQAAEELIRSQSESEWDYVAHESTYHKTPQSKRIQWTKDFCEEYTQDALKVAIVTNDYQLINLIEHHTQKGKFFIFHMDANETVETFIDLRPNPTLEIGEYLFTCSVKRALKGG